jgi:large subunit ribosomal protein L9
MKVILTSKIKTLGEVGDIKEVASGYGRNYLIPKNLAIVYSEYNYRSFGERRKLLEENSALSKSRAEEIRTKIDEKELTMTANAGENDKLYGSVNSKNIADFINSLIDESYLTKNNIFLQRPIKTLGKFTVTLSLHPDVSFEKELSIVRGESKTMEFTKSSDTRELSAKEKNQEENS